MKKKFDVSQERWRAIYSDSPAAVLKGWQLKVADSVQFPLGVIPEPLGGLKSKDGRSPRQKARAKCAAAAPRMLNTLVNELFSRTFLGATAPDILTVILSRKVLLTHK